MTDTICYVCKYTPLELLEGFGLPSQRLDPAPASFECADSCAHPNLCGYGKAVLEEVLTKEIDCLLLVDCCDVCRRIYDILLERADMKFLFLFALPHKNGKKESALVKKELLRLSDALKESFGVCWKEEQATAAWRKAAAARDIEKPYVLVTGAHGGSMLLNTVRERIPLSVKDETCSGSRLLEAPDGRSGPQVPSGPDGPSEGFYAGYAEALLGQAHPCMRMQFRREEADPEAAGVICHTMKFCDYYGFAYRHGREKYEVPYLKIETDSTPQSGGQLHTRLDAFYETIRAENGISCAKKPAIRYAAGVDSGSASTDAVILDQERRIVGSAILPTGPQSAAGAQKALAEALSKARLKLSDLDSIVTTGYGRETTGVSDASVTEITCHAKGAHFLYPQARTVIDIGGQDSKIIRIDETGAVVSFVMNDKCAAGTGRFLEMMARTLQLSLPEMSEMGLKWKNEIAISSMCTVFAESEVVSLIAQNTPAEDIIHGLNLAVAGKTVSLIRRLGGEPAYIMTGGVAQNQGVVKALRQKLQEDVYVCEEAQLCGALGAALIALEGSSL